MRLSSLKLVGFKSFVDSTVVPFRAHMNAIVGPNGCGKSNIVDAIRWVIGETSAKQLRGQSMSDVIFNGTTTRKPVGKAAIELVFENTGGRLTGEYAKFAQLAIRREVTRDGQSNYYINGASCRRRDITDIFLGTGLGTRSYAIVEQGMVSRLIEAKPEEMRIYIEEAAGISRYKERRRETENRMRHTRENMDRLNDIRLELEKQLRSLKRQANAAERYKEYKAEERQLQAQIKALQWRGLQDRLQDFNEHVQKAEVELEGKLAEQRHLEVDIEQSRQVHGELNAEFNNAQRNYYSLDAEIARVEQQLKDHKQQMQRWQSELEESEQNFQELTENTRQYYEQIEQIEQAIAELSPQSSDLENQVEIASQVLQQAQQAMSQWQQQWDEFQDDHAEAAKRAEVARTKIHHHQQQLQQLQRRLDQLEQREDQRTLVQLESEIEPLSEQVVELEQQICQVNERLADIAQQISTQRQQNNTADELIETAREALQQSQAQLASLQALQQSALGYDDESTQEWLTQHGLHDQTRLGQAIKVESGWELALETVLSGKLDAICVDQVADYALELQGLSQGRITLVDRSVSQSAAALPELTTLSSKVQTSLSLSAWLSGVYVAEDLATAQALRDKLADNESIITRDGLWLGVNWLQVAKAVTSENSVLLRAQALDDITTTIDAQKQQLALHQQQWASGDEALLALELSRDEQHQQYQTLSSQLTQTKSQLTAKQSRHKALQQQLQSLLQEIEELRHQRDLAQQSVQEMTEILGDSEAGMENFAMQKVQLQEQKQDCEIALNEAREALHREQQRADELGIRLASNESQLSLLRQTLVRDERQLNHLKDRRELLTERLAEGDEPQQQFENELQQLLSQRSELEQNLHQAEQAFNENKGLLERLERQRQQCGQQFQSLQTSLQELRMERQTLTVRQTTIQEQLTEMEVDLTETLQALPQQADLADSEQQAQRIAQRIEKLGPINLAAIEEYKATEERKEYLDKQDADLSEALAILESAIRKIDKETKMRFKETYEQVNAGVQRLFPKIFGGGSASLSLTDEDILTAGVIVRAQPPGKRNATIHMLSGGEKALTAIALIFSLFELNPAPFCVLDEVDAPLDDLNVSRFCNLVKEMSSKTQFIVISHNKVTIEAADNLMGITMQEPGVSRVVSVDMEEAMAMVDAT